MKRFFLIPLLFLVFSFTACKAQNPSGPLPEVRGDFTVHSVCQDKAIVESVTQRLFEVPATGTTETGDAYKLKEGREYHLRLEVTGKRDAFHIKAQVKTAHDSERQNRVDRARSIKIPSR